MNPTDEPTPAQDSLSSHAPLVRAQQIARKQYEALLFAFVLAESGRRLARLLHLSASLGVTRTNLPSELLRHIDAGATADAGRASLSTAVDDKLRPAAEQFAAICELPYDELFSPSVVRDYALSVADDANGLAFWFASWDEARDAPAWWKDPV